MDDYSQYFRTVDIRISGRYTGNVSGSVIALIVPILGGLVNDGKDASGIMALLTAKSWAIIDVADESGWSGDYIYRITATVAGHYSDRQIQDQIQRDLAGLFTVTGVTILSQPYTVPGIFTGNTTGNGGLYQLPPIDGGVVYGSTPGAANPNAPAAPAAPGSDFLSSLGLGAGITTPIAVLGGLILLVVVLKK